MATDGTGGVGAAFFTEFGCFPDSCFRFRVRKIPRLLDQAPTTRRDWRARVMPFALAACITVGAALRLWGVGSSPLDFGESFTAMAGRRPTRSLFPFLRVADSHRPHGY